MVRKRIHAHAFRSLADPRAAVEAVIGLRDLGLDFGAAAEVGVRTAARVNERGVRFVENVLVRLPPIARHFELHVVDDAGARKAAERQLRRFTFPEVGEDQAQMLAHRIRRNRRRRARTRRPFTWARDAGSGTVVRPAVVEALHGVAADPADRQLRAAVRAAKADQMRRPRLAAIEREPLAHHVERNQRTGFELFGDVDRLPRRSQAASRPAYRVRPT